MRGRRTTWILIGVGALFALMGPLFVSLTADNLRRQLIVTALGAAVLGLGIGRLPIARE